MRRNGRTPRPRPRRRAGAHRRRRRSELCHQPKGGGLAPRGQIFWAAHNKGARGGVFDAPSAALQIPLGTRKIRKVRQKGHIGREIRRGDKLWRLQFARIFHSGHNARCAAHSARGQPPRRKGNAPARQVCREDICPLRRQNPQAKERPSKIFRISRQKRDKKAAGRGIEEEIRIRDGRETAARARRQPRGRSRSTNGRLTISTGSPKRE